MLYDELPAKGPKPRTCLAHEHGLYLFLDTLPDGQALASAEDEDGAVLWKVEVEDWEIAYETLRSRLNRDLPA